MGKVAGVLYGAMGLIVGVIASLATTIEGPLKATGVAPFVNLDIEGNPVPAPAK